MRKSPKKDQLPTTLDWISVEAKTSLKLLPIVGANLGNNVNHLVSKGGPITVYITKKSSKMKGIVQSHILRLDSPVLGFYWCVESEAFFNGCPTHVAFFLANDD